MSRGHKTNGTPLELGGLEDGGTTSVVFRGATDPELMDATPDRGCGMNTAADAPCKFGYSFSLIFGGNQSS